MLLRRSSWLMIALPRAHSFSVFLPATLPSHRSAAPGDAVEEIAMRRNDMRCCLICGMLGACDGVVVAAAAAAEWAQSRNATQ